MRYLVIGVKSRPSFIHCTRDYSHVLNKLQVIARNFDWSIALFLPGVIGRNNGFGIGLGQSFELRSIELSNRLSCPLFEQTE